MWNGFYHLWKEIDVNIFLDVLNLYTFGKGFLHLFLPCNYCCIFLIFFKKFFLFCSSLRGKSAWLREKNSRWYIKRQFYLSLFFYILKCFEWFIACYVSYICFLFLIFFLVCIYIYIYFNFRKCITKLALPIVVA